MADLTFGLGVAGILLLGAVLLIVGYFGKKSLGKFPAQLFAAFGVVAILLGVIVWAGIPALVSDEEEQIVPGATYDVSVTESESEVTVNEQTHKVTVAMIYNTTSDAFGSNTGDFELNFTIMRSDVLLTDSVAVSRIGNIPQVDVTGAADEYIVDQNADDSFKVYFTKAGSISAYESMNVRLEAGDSAWLLVNVTLNGAAVHAMDENDIVEFSISIAGETWYIACLLDTVLT